jgi:hypothetical protein
MTAMQLSGAFGANGAGDIMVIEGTGFDTTTPANNVVRFETLSETAEATVVQAGATQLHVRVPAQAVNGDITVRVGGQTSNAVRPNP